jgi:hydrogenase small subunit
MANVLWLQGGACSGNTISFLSAEQPTAVELVTDFGIHIIWHPSMGLEIGEQVTAILQDCLSGKISVDIFVFEGTVIQGPKGRGTMNYFCERPMQVWVQELAAIAHFVVAIGDCAAWGGIPAVPPNPTESTGMQFHKREKGGFLGAGFISKGGLPVINIPGCPAHPDWVTQILVAISTGRIKDMLMDDFQRPTTFFTDFVQTGCTNTRSFQEKISGGFGKRGGCLFYEVGCRGSITHASCNRILWNRQSSKTRSNHPCLGCTEPGFPHHDLKRGSIFKSMQMAGSLPKEKSNGDLKRKKYFKITE